MIDLPTQSELHRFLDYDPDTGLFIWKERGILSWDRRWAGKPAFTGDWNGYKVGVLLGRRCIGAHRVAFKYVFGIDPIEVDHINGDRRDNRISNLRSVTTAENRKNSARPSHNTSGTVGVRYREDKRRWSAYISINNSYKYLGYFKTREAAVLARKRAERELGYHPNHGRG